MIEKEALVLSFHECLLHPLAVSSLLLHLGHHPSIVLPLSFLFQLRPACSFVSSEAGQLTPAQERLHPRLDTAATSPPRDRTSGIILSGGPFQPESTEQAFCSATIILPSHASRCLPGLHFCSCPIHIFNVKTSQCSDRTMNRSRRKKTKLGGGWKKKRKQKEQAKKKCKWTTAKN